MELTLQETDVKNILADFIAEKVLDGHTWTGDSIELRNTQDGPIANVLSLTPAVVEEALKEHAVENFGSVFKNPTVKFSNRGAVLATISSEAPPESKANGKAKTSKKKADVEESDK